MEKLVELRAMADSIGLKVELEKTDDKEVYRVYQDGKEITSGSYEAVKVKLEDFMDMKNLESKIKELINAGKTDEEIKQILADDPSLAYPRPEGGPTPEDLMNDHSIAEMVEQFSSDTVSHLNTTYNLELTDVAGDNLKEAIGATLKEWYLRNNY